VGITRRVGEAAVSLAFGKQTLPFNCDVGKDPYAELKLRRTTLRTEVKLSPNKISYAEPEIEKKSRQPVRTLCAIHQALYIPEDGVFRLQ